MRLWQPAWWCNNHLEKYESQWEGLFIHSYEMENKIHVWNHQPDSHLMTTAEVFNIFRPLNKSQLESIGPTDLELRETGGFWFQRDRMAHLGATKWIPNHTCKAPYKMRSCSDFAQESCFRCLTLSCTPNSQPSSAPCSSDFWRVGHTPKLQGRPLSPSKEASEKLRRQWEFSNEMNPHASISQSLIYTRRKSMLFDVVWLVSETGIRCSTMNANGASHICWMFSWGVMWYVLDGIWTCFLDATPTSRWCLGRSWSLNHRYGGNCQKPYLVLVINQQKKREPTWASPCSNHENEHRPAVLEVGIRISTWSFHLTLAHQRSHHPILQWLPSRVKSLKVVMSDSCMLYAPRGQIYLAKDLVLRCFKLVGEYYHWNHKRLSCTLSSHPRSPARVSASAPKHTKGILNHPGEEKHMRTSTHPHNHGKVLDNS